MSEEFLETPPLKQPFTSFLWNNWFGKLYRLIKALLAPRYAHIYLSDANLTKGTTAPTQVIVGNYNGWDFTVGDDAVLDIILPHSVDASKELIIEFSFAVNEAYALKSAVVAFQVTYSLAAIGENISTPVTSGTLTTGDIQIPTNAYDRGHDASMIIPAGTYTNGDLIGITFSRVASVGTAPTAHPIILVIQIKYTRKSINWAS